MGWTREQAENNIADFARRNTFTTPGLVPIASDLPKGEKQKRSWQRAALPGIQPDRTGGDTRGRKYASNTERLYALELEAQRKAGVFVSWEYEPIRLKIGDDVHYIPDFLIKYADGSLEFHEVKGRFTPDGLVKIKVAADKYQFARFLAVFRNRKKDGGDWRFELYGKETG